MRYVRTPNSYLYGLYNHPRLRVSAPPGAGETRPQTLSRQWVTAIGPPSCRCVNRRVVQSIHPCRASRQTGGKPAFERPPTRSKAHPEGFETPAPGFECRCFFRSATGAECSHGRPVSAAGFEPATCSLGGSRSVQLSYADQSSWQCIRQGSNLRPPARNAGALSAELRMPVIARRSGGRMQRSGWGAQESNLEHRDSESSVLPVAPLPSERRGKALWSRALPRNTARSPGNAKGPDGTGPTGPR